MRQIVILHFLGLIFFTSCKNSGNKNLSYSIRDSVLQEHLAALDSLPYFDTTDINYKILKAYKSNDTFFFKNLHIDIEREKKFRHQWDLIDSCAKEQKLSDLNVDEAYRFIYQAAFCPYKVNVTITKKTDSASLHFLIYQYQWDTAKCRIINEFDKKLPIKNWTEITESLDKYDFWGLKRENGVHGLDGSSLTVIGYKKRDTLYRRETKTNFIYRWGGTTLGEPFHLVLKISGNKQGCFWIE